MTDMTTIDRLERAEAMGERPARDVIEAVQRITRDLPALGKGGRNKEQGYDFREIEAIKAALQPLLAKHGVNIRTRTLSREVESFTTKTGTVWTDTTVQVEYVFHGPKGGEDVVVYGPFFGLGRDNSSFGTVKAMSQAYKIMCNDAFCISDRTDADEAKTHEREAPAAPQEAPGVGAAIAEAFYKSAEKAGVERETVDSWARELAGVATVPEVPRTHWNLLRDRYAVHLQEAKTAPPAQGVSLSPEGSPASAESEASTGEGHAPQGGPAGGAALGSRAKKAQG